MAVPKRRLSRSNTRHRRSTWRATPGALVHVTGDGEVVRVPRRIVRAVERGLGDPRNP